jgi:glucose-1-phosphate thymidylyltransferase
MKGVIMAGGNATRLFPLTRVVNKHLLPVGDKPMLQHSVEKMVDAGIDQIMVVTGGEHLGGIAEFLGGGSRFGCRITFRVQEEAGGIAQGLGLAKDFVGNDMVCVLLGDNIFESSLKPLVLEFERGWMKAMIVIKGVPDPERFGVPEIKNGFVVGIEEKPETPKSRFAVTGIYFYDSAVFGIIGGLKPSGRGEMEITDVNNAYIARGNLGCVEIQGWWTDAGTHESYKKANDLVRGIGV